MAAFPGVPLQARGDLASYVHTTVAGTIDLMAVLWVDRERRFCISSASTAMPVTPCRRLQWGQCDERAGSVPLTVPQPQVAEVHCDCYAPIEQHNCCRQNDTPLEHELFMHYWTMHVNLSLLGTCVLDSWLLSVGARVGHPCSPSVISMRTVLLSSSTMCSTMWVSAAGQPVLPRRSKTSTCALAEWQGSSPDSDSQAPHGGVIRECGAAGAAAMPRRQEAALFLGVLQVPGDRERGCVLLLPQDWAPML